MQSAKTGVQFAAIFAFGSRQRVFRAKRWVKGVDMCHSSKQFFAVLCLLAPAFTSQTTSAQSVWQKMKEAAKQQACRNGDQKACQDLAQHGQQQPGQQQPQQPGQKPSQPGQRQQPGQATDNSGPITPPPGTKIEQAVLAPVAQGASYVVSSTGIHVATLSHSGSRQVVIYDGVEGPKFDQIFPEGTNFGVVFSPDGNRYAYCGQSGNQYVVMVDGKELARSSDSIGGVFSAFNCTLGFTSNSKHVYYTTTAGSDSNHTVTRFVFDGKASPPGAPSDMRQYIFSPDGDHFAYIWYDPSPNSQRSLLIVDGKPAPYLSGSPQWSADSQHLYTKRSARVPGSTTGQATEVLLDGKPIIRTDIDVTLYIPPVGDMVVALVRKSAGRGAQSEFFVIGGKMVPGSELVGDGSGIGKVIFSPDGKHYAAQYTNANQRSFVFADGKKGLEYAKVGFVGSGPNMTIPEAFTADSSKVVYIGTNSGSAFSQYLVIGDEESDELRNASETVFSPVGSHVATIGPGEVIVDGKTILKLNGVDPQSHQTHGLMWSPDGNHFAVVGHQHDGPVLYLDGEGQSKYWVLDPRAGVTQAPFIFSPDSKHLAYFCVPANPAGGNAFGICLDGKNESLPASNYANLTFTPDSKHLFWAGSDPSGRFRLYLDGKPVLDAGIGGANVFTDKTWQMGPDGTLAILVQDDTSLKRVRITPSQ